jgi:signal transduction histidine kinase
MFIEGGTFIVRHFIRKALQKYDKLTREQIYDLLVTSSNEIDRLEIALESLTMGVLVCDINNNLLFSNHSAELMLKIEAYEQGEDTARFAARNDTISEFLYNVLRNGEIVRDREFYCEVNDIQRLINVSVLPLVTEHRVTGSLVLIEDITEKRTREAQLRRVESLASLTNLAAGVAHEIKNPLGAISIHIQLIAKALAGAKIKYEITNTTPQVSYDMLEKHIRIVNEEIDRLNHIVVDFLFAVRPMSMSFIKADIHVVIKEIVELLKYEFEQKKITVRMVLTETMPFILLDERYIKQALLNLVKNAVEAMSRDGGTLTIRTFVRDGNVHVVIADTGSGISKEHIAKVFEPYFTTKQSGTGLGLTLVFKIIREHNGDINAKSRPGHGTRFTIKLPLPADHLLTDKSEQIERLKSAGI